jgi:uncharacterized protein
MEPRVSLITLGVADLERAERFYTQVLKLPKLETPPGVAFYELGTTWLSLHLREQLAADVGVADSPQAAFPGFTLAHNLRSEAEVDALMAEVESGGARIVKPAQRAFWGGYSGYFADPDGFLWEVAWNPGFPHV